MALKIISQRRLTPAELRHIRSFGSLPLLVSRRQALRYVSAGLVAATAPPLVGARQALAQSPELAALIIRRLDIAAKVFEVGAAVVTFIKAFNDKPEPEAKPILLNTANFRGILEGQTYHEVVVEPESVVDIEADAPPATSPGEKTCTCKSKIDSKSISFEAV